MIGEPDVDAAALMARAADGDRGAWRELYLAYRDYVFRTALRFLGSEAQAADITQDVFVALFGRARQYKPQARFTTFLFRVVANRCLNERARAHTRLHDDDASKHDALARLSAGPSENPEAHLRRAESAAAVRRAILALTERQRLAVILSRFEGLSYEEIALAMSTSVGTVESLLFRARRKLGELLR